MILAALIAILVGVVMHFLQREIKNATVRLDFKSIIHELPEFELYYSPDGSFKGDRIVVGIVDSVKRNTVEFCIPNGLYRHLRLDIPKSDTLTVSSLQFQYWPFSFELSGYDLANACDLKNDVQFRFNEAQEMIIYSGKVDPFLVISNENLLSSYLFYQIKRQQYPIWMSILFFLLILISLSVFKSRGKVAITSLFFLFLTIPSITFFLKEDVLDLETEKRKALPKPTFEGSLLDFTSSTSGYLEDQFGGRAGMITAWNFLRVAAFGQTAHSAAVFFGEEPWMFYRAEGVQEVYENKQPFTESQLQKMCTVLQERKDWLAYYGIDYYVFFPPLKHTIYEEHLPKRIKKANNRSKMDQLVDAVKATTDVNVIDLRNVLFEAKKKEDRPVYYYVDSHWNLLGAHHAYQEIVNTVKEDHPLIGDPSEKEDFNWFETLSTDGDLAYVLSLNTYLLRSEIVPDPFEGYCADSIASINYPSHESVHEVQTREVKGLDKKMLKLVMNRDSYSNFLIPFLAEHFERSVYLWTPLFNAEVIKEEKPDIFMTEMLERFMIDLTMDNPPIVKQELEAFKALEESLNSQAEIVGTQR